LEGKLNKCKKKDVKIYEKEKEKFNEEREKIINEIIIPKYIKAMESYEMKNIIEFREILIKLNVLEKGFEKYCDLKKKGKKKNKKKKLMMIGKIIKI
jgi:hypothetical protein